jgi:hypothetical protein
VADGALGPDTAAVAFGDALDAGQADAGAGEIGDRVEPLERLEQLAGEGGIEAGPVVADVAAEPGVPGRRSGAELDGGVLAPGGEFPGVLDQVLQHGADQGTVRGDPDAVVDGEADGAARLAGVQFGADGVNCVKSFRHQTRIRVVNFLKLPLKPLSVAISTNQKHFTVSLW